MNSKLTEVLKACYYNIQTPTFIRKCIVGVEPTLFFPGLSVVLT